MEYQPRRRRGRLAIPFGWYVLPEDQSILIPDPKKIEALEYAFKQRAKYKTPIRDCTMWLHAATGQLMTPAGFMYAYKRWLKKINKEYYAEVKARRKETLKLNDEKTVQKYYKYTIITDDKDAISSVAHEELRIRAKKKTLKKVKKRAG